LKCLEGAGCEKTRSCALAMSFELNVELGESKDIKFGECSIFDIYLNHSDDLPFVLPVKLYLEEMLIGMHGGSKDASEKKASAKVAANWERLKGVLDTDAMRDTCRYLFGITLGIITKRAREDAIEELRQRLAQSWALVALEVKKKSREGAGVDKVLDTQDALNRCLPVILIQCIYRLLVDGFAEDKQQFVHECDQMLEKIAHVVTYEISGFKLNSSTWTKERLRVFQTKVTDHPSSNQHDSLKLQVRREFLENQNKHPTPLVFGSQDSMPLEETQLEHVMNNRELARDSKSEESVVPSHLSVDRYTSIALIGEQLLHRHLEELHPEIVTMESTVLPASRKNKNFSKKFDSTGSEESSGGRRGGVMLDRDFMRARKDAELAEKRRREDMLQALIVNEPLPAFLRDRSLETAWVSPITDRLVPCEQHRQGLRKRASESVRLKMGLPMIMQSHSEPSLRKPFKLPKISSHHHAPGAHGHDASDGAHSVHVPEKKVHKMVTDLTMGPPAYLKSAAIIHRLGDHLEHFHRNTFAVYKMENDLASGVRKHFLNPEALRTAETGYVSSLHTLVGPNDRPGLSMLDSPERRAKLHSMKSQSGPLLR